VTNVVGAGRAELVGDLARPLPFDVICAMVGLPGEDRDVFYRLTMAQLLNALSMENAVDAATKLGNFFRGLLEARREQPRDDLVSALATAEVDGESLPEEVAVAFLRQLMSAGGETTFRTLSMLLYALLTHPEQHDALREDRSLVPAAIEEALRWEGPVVWSTRETTQQTVLAGVPLPAGAHLDVSFGAANRDPAVFAHPDVFDIHRPKGRHFAFALGVHNCIGQQLARLEMTTALEALLDRAPQLRLDPDAPAPRVRGAAMRVPNALHVRPGG